MGCGQSSAPTVIPSHIPSPGITTFPPTTTGNNNNNMNAVPQTSSMPASSPAFSSALPNYQPQMNLQPQVSSSQQPHLPSQVQQPPQNPPQSLQVSQVQPPQQLQQSQVHQLPMQQLQPFQQQYYDQQSHTLPSQQPFVFQQMPQHTQQPSYPQVTPTMLQQPQQLQQMQPIMYQQQPPPQQMQPGYMMPVYQSPSPYYNGTTIITPGNMVAAGNQGTAYVLTSNNTAPMNFTNGQYHTHPTGGYPASSAYNSNGGMYRSNPGNQGNNGLQLAGTFAAGMIGGALVNELLDGDGFLDFHF